MQQNLQGDAYRLHPVLQHCLLISLQGASHVNCIRKPLSMKFQRTILHLHTGSYSGWRSAMAAAKRHCYAPPIACRTMHCCRLGKATAYCTRMPNKGWMNALTLTIQGSHTSLIA